MSNKSLALPHNELTILVTGGAGFIGSHTCIELLGQNYNVVIVDDLLIQAKLPLNASVNFLAQMKINLFFTNATSLIAKA